MHRVKSLAAATVNAALKTGSLVSGSRHSSHKPAIDITAPSAALMKYGFLPPSAERHS
jgi:hypothetical protein